MPQPRYQSGLNDSFGAPGVYIKELAVTAPIRGLFTGITGIVGQCVKGPVNTFVECDSYQRFIDVFGGRDYGVNGGAVINNIWAALQGLQWGILYIIRAAAAAAVAASYEANTAAAHGGANVLNIAASSVGAWGNNLQWKVLAASNGVSTSFNLSIIDQNTGKSYLYENIDISSGDNTAVVVGNDYATPIVLTKLANGRPINSTPSTDGANAAGYINLGATNSGYISVAGSDGSIADADYTASGGPMETMNNTVGIDHWFVAGRSNTNIKTKLFALTATANDHLILACPDSSSISISTAVTEVATMRNQNMVYCFNHWLSSDPVTTLQVTAEPHALMGSILSQIEPDVHPGVVDTSPLTQSVINTIYQLANPDRDTLDAAGISYLNRDLDQSGNQVFIFGNGRTTDLTVNNSQIDGQRSKFYIVAGLAQRMRGDEKKPNTANLRAARAAAFSAWLTELANSNPPRFVNKDDSGNPLFTVANDSTVNTKTDWAAGIQRDLVMVQLIPKNLYLQLQIEIGTDVTFNTSPNAQSSALQGGQ